MLDKGIQNFGECVRVEGIARRITSNTHWDLWHNSFRCEVEFSTRVQPQQLANKTSFVQRLLRITVCLLSTPLLKSTSTARRVTSAHGRTLTIIAEGQHPSTPCGHRCLRTHVSRCSQTHVHTISSGLRAIDTYEQTRLTSNSLSN